MPMYAFEKVSSKPDYVSDHGHFEYKDIKGQLHYATHLKESHISYKFIGTIVKGVIYPDEYIR